jgi:tetratricopeptide (TPR) repeat protein
VAIVGLWIRLAWNPEGWAETAESEATKAIAAFESMGDDRGLGKAWALLGLVHLERAQFGPAQEAWEKSAEHARRAGERRDALESLAWVPLGIWAGPTDTETGLRRCSEVYELARGDRKVMASALAAEAAFEAGLGRFGDARERIGRAKALLEEVALTVWLAGPVAQFAGWIELLAGDLAAAERELRWGHDTLVAIGELSWLSTVEAILAEAVYAQGRHDEAEQLTRASEESAGAEDIYSQALLRSVRGKILARRGDAEDAARLAEEAVALADRSDFPHLRWHTRLSRAEVQRLVGEPSAPVLEEAIRIAEAKGSAEAARQAGELLESGRG